MTKILNCDTLENMTQKFATIVEDSQNKKCNRDLATYGTSRRRIDQINYKKSVKIAKQVFLIIESKKSFQLTKDHGIL